MSNDVHIAKISKIQKENTRTTAIGRKKETDENMPSPRDLNSPDQTQSDNNISSCSTLDIVNLTQQQLENQIRELSKRLQKSEDERIFLERQLKECCDEKDICLRRLEHLSSSHECRITEMHCVIAELSKKLRAKQENVIVEEQEDDGEASYQEGSIYNSEMNLTNPDAECQTDPLESTGDEQDACLVEQTQLDYFEMDLNDRELKLNEHASKGQIEALQEEVLHLKAQIAFLQSEIANSNLVKQTKEIMEQLPETDYCENQNESEEIDANESNCSSDKLLFVQSSKISTAPQQMVNATEMNIPKMAERVKLRCNSQTVLENDSLENDLNSKVLQNIAILDRFLLDEDSVLHNIVEPEDYDNEIQRLQRRIEHLKMQNYVLTLTLEESSSHCEHLYLLCGKFESNAIGLQIALNCSDRAIEAYDVMLALLESKLALMKEKSTATEESRKAVEAVARHLLDRLECEKNLCENSLGPWQNTFNISEKVNLPWTADDDNRLRCHVSKLKGCRSTVQNTIVNLESPFCDHEKVRIAAFESGSELKNQERVAHLDLEMAVVMQELLQLREENTSLKMKIESLNKERQLNFSRIGILEGALNQLQLQLGVVDTQSHLFQQQEVIGFENRVSYSEAEHTALIEQQLVEALTRESELRNRIQSLIATVAATQKTNETKIEQRELDSNVNMAQQLEHNKRKYQTRIRKLEQKLSELTVGPAATCSIKKSNERIPETTL